jgi:formaldehyde-activating enzyme involved in methanogenesis
MPKVTIERFIEGRSFQPEAVAAMGQALEEVLEVLGIGPHEDAKKRAVVVQTIVRLASADESLGATSLRDRTIEALGVGKGK